MVTTEPDATQRRFAARLKPKADAGRDLNPSRQLRARLPVSKTSLSAASRYSVQPMTSEGQPDKSTCIHVDAEGPVRAAEIALGETLVIHGRPEQARAKVWHLADDFSPVSVTLFRPVTEK